MVSRRHLLTALVVVVPAALAVALLVGVPTDVVEAPSDHATTVAVHDEDGTRLGTVAVRVADSGRERYVGLSETAALEEDEGMLFVYQREGNRTYVMRNMSFALDIVFVGADRTITTIHRAPTPDETESEDLVRYRGRAKWVLEVNAGWTDAQGVDPGDRIQISGRNG